MPQAGYDVPFFWGKCLMTRLVYVRGGWKCLLAFSRIYCEAKGYFAPARAMYPRIGWLVSGTTYVLATSLDSMCTACHLVSGNLYVVITTLIIYPRKNRQVPLNHLTCRLSFCAVEKCPRQLV